MFGCLRFSPLQELYSIMRANFIIIAGLTIVVILFTYYSIVVMSGVGHTEQLRDK